MSTFDVWIISFEPGDSPPAERLEDAFGMDSASARALEQSLPKIVKHAIPAKAAGEMRQALEAIGAVVECRPAREVRPAASAGGAESAAVFHPPGEDLFPAGRVSAIDPFAPAREAGVPRISVDEPIPPIPVAQSQPPSETEEPRRVTASLLATSRDRQRRKFLRQAVGTMFAGAAIIAIGWFLGNSVLRGEADWIGIGFDGLGIYFLGVGLYDLVTTVRS
ncbi:MAG: hypothetical protein EP303_01910 [Deltaproteobacteria bacterium]|nr:MAG: hypothetical protein EP303_01910 [Deltaproteobacteria bacterium]